MDKISDAQADMRFGYLSGAPGVLASAIVWLVAGVVALQVSPKTAVWTLFVGGMFIHPVGILLAKVLGRSGKHTPGNPLSSLAAANTCWLMLSLPLAYAVSLLRIEWFFPAMLFIIGGRYLTFAPLYGMRIYWACGGVLALAGCLLGSAYVQPAFSALTGAAIEACFGTFILFAARREMQPNIAPTRTR